MMLKSWAALNSCHNKKKGSPLHYRVPATRVPEKKGSLLHDRVPATRVPEKKGSPLHDRVPVMHAPEKRFYHIVQEYDDRLNKLPGDVLLLIICNLTMDEAVRLSLVSQQCEFIWRYVPVLIFENFQAIEKIQRCRRCRDTLAHERPHFARRVDNVLEKHLGTTIDELRITFDLDQDWQSHVDRWAAFALDKRVKRLEFNFKSHWRRCYETHKGVRTPICGEPLGLSPAFISFKSSLISLCLRYVNVTDDFVDCLSCQCPLLESLCVEGSELLTRISGSLQVKHLEVSQCLNLKKIDISARKLHSFILNSHPIELHIKDASSLIEMSIGTEIDRCPVSYAFDSLSEHFSQLVYLSLRIRFADDRNLRIGNVNPFALPNLQHLELQVHAKVSQSIRGWFSLIEASPSIQKLTLKLDARDIDYKHFWPLRSWGSWDNFPIKCLKTLELVGYVGQPIDLELAIFVLENASVLEEVILDFFSHYSFKWNDNEKRERLAKLQVHLPQGVKLTVK